MKNLSQKISAGLICETCFFAPDICLCHLIPKLDIKTKISLIIHKNEMNRSSNTGRLALQALPHSELKIRGHKTGYLDLSELINNDYESLLLFPSEDAIFLTKDLLKGIKNNIQLIVPDGNWKQARKVHTRHKELGKVTRVMVPRDVQDRYFLRQEHSEHGMATLQAIANALGMIEGEDVKNQLLALYEEKLIRTLRTHGKLDKKLG